jgi:SAM-dependent methyltransferase
MRESAQCTVRGVQSCPACGGQLDEWCSVGSSEPSLSGRTFTLRRCVACGTAVTTGESLPQLHESGAYSPTTPRLHRLVTPILAAFDRHRLALLEELAPPPRRLLDAGAGRGRFVLAATRAGYEATGIEPSERGVRAALGIGADVRHASIEDAEIEPASLDAVTIWHVLEHMDDPAAGLTRIAGWLSPGAAVLVGAPNLASVQARLGLRYWYHLDVPRHRVHFTPQGLAALLQRTGFTPVRTQHVLLEHNPFGMWQSMVNRMTRRPSYLYNLLKRNAPLGSPDLPISIAALPLAPVAALAELLAGASGRGGTIAVLARSRGGYH